MALTKFKYLIGSNVRLHPNALIEGRFAGREELSSNQSKG